MTQNNIQVFSKFADGEYDQHFVQPIPDFYSDIVFQLAYRLPENALILDIGAGPGSLAKTMSEKTDIKVTIYGLEPSQTHEDGVKLSEQLKDSNVQYIPKQGTISDVEKLFDLHGLEGIILSRSSHEIAKSLGGKQEFYSEIKKLMGYLKPSGIILIGDPTYAFDIRLDKETHSEEIELARRILEEKLGHSDSVDTLFSPTEIIQQIEMQNCELRYYNTHANQELLQEMRNYERFKGLTRSPTELFIAIFQKCE